jgi:flagellar motor switch protein FliM
MMQSEPYAPPMPTPMPDAERSAGPSVSAVSIRRWDLTGKERHLRAAVGVMARVAQAFVRGCRRSMPFLVRYRCHVAPGTVETLASAAEFLGEPNEHAFTARLASDGGRAWAAVSLDAGAIALVIEGALGGRAMTTLEPLSQPPTAAQKALLGRIVLSLAGDLAAALAEEAKLELARVSDDHSHTNVPPAGDVLRVACTVEGLGTPASVIIAVSAPSLEASCKEAAEDEPSLDPRLADTMREVPVEVVAELGRVQVGLRSLLGLRVGEVLRLPTATDDPLTVRVGGVAKFAASPIVSRGQLAIEIKARHEP